MELTDLMRRDVVTVYIDDPLLEVAAELRREGVGSAVVLDAGDEVIGIVTDRDLVVYGLEFAGEIEQTTVNRVLSKIVFSADPNTGIRELTERMREEEVRRVPVTSDGELLGIVTLDDIIVHLSEQLDSPLLDNLAAVITAESPPQEPRSADSEPYSRT